MGIRLRNALALVANLVVFISTCICVASFFISGGQGNMQVAGWTAFRYFTVDSNILAAIGCLCGIGYNMASLITESDGMPRWVLLLRYAGTVAVSLTFIVTVCFLSFIYGFGPLFAGKNLFLHGINPLLCILTFVLLDKGPIRFREVWIPLVPVLLYGAVYVIMVVAVGYAAGGWPDFYRFNTGGLWPVVIVAIGAVAFGIAVAERLTHREGVEELDQRPRRDESGRGEALLRARRRQAEEAELEAELAAEADAVEAGETAIIPEP